MMTEDEARTNCACKSHDAYNCWALRYFGHTDVTGMAVDADGGPCECSCHYDSDLPEDQP